MAADKSVSVTYKSIEELQVKQGISDAVFEGVKVSNGWKAGKQITDAEFEKACSEFLKAPVSGKTPAIKKGGKS